MSGGSVNAWGDNSVGQLGNPNFLGTFDVPVAVPINGVAAGSAGGGFSLALGAGTVAAWGDNNVGQLGTGHQEYGLDSEPQQVVGLTGVVAISAGSITARSHRTRPGSSPERRSRVPSSAPLSPSVSPSRVP